MKPLKKTFPRLISGLIFLVALGIVGYILIHQQTAQWDFRTYYHAARVDMEGGDPYDSAQVSRAAGVEHALPFLYPPLTLWLFKLFASFSYSVAFYLWLVFKIVLLSLLVFVWRRHFLMNETPWLVYLFVMFAFGAPISYDLNAGNVSIIEQTLIWGGFYFLKEKKTGAFCLLIVAASIFKWTPIVFLLLLLTLKVERRWFYLVSSSLGFLLTVVVSYFSDPARFMVFASAAMARDERGGDANPSILSLIRDSLEFIARFGVPDVLVSILPFIIYLAVVGLVLWFTAKYFQFADVKTGAGSIVCSIFMASLVYALVMPRFKTYSFILLLPAGFYVIRRCYRYGAFPLLFILVALSADPSLPGQLFVSRLNPYYPLLIAYGLWVLWLLSLRSTSDHPPFPEVSSGSSG